MIHHKYDLGDIFMRQYSNGNVSYYMVIELMDAVDKPSTPIYEILKFDDGDYDFWAETWLNCLKKVG